MEDVNISKFRAQVVRAGSTPASPGFVVSVGQNPVDPSGSGQNHLPVTIATAATGLSITESQILSGAGTVGQYIRGDGSLADFPATTGGGSSVSYYLNGSVSQGTIGGVAYKELNKTPIFGAGTDITINADGYIASFITDAGDPNKLLIPAGNWNFETYFSASSNGGSPSFYIELYKYNGTTFTLIASSSSAPELIAFGTNLNPYFSTLAVPETVLALTDRLALRYYVTHSGRTITLHTENNHLCQVITTFTSGLTALNGLTSQVQYLTVGTSGTDFAISSATDTHTFNLPTASATNRGALSSADWSTFNNKQNALTNPVTGTGTSGQVAYFNGTSAITGESGFTWDASNNRLSIGGTTANSNLTVSGSDNTDIFTLLAGANSRLHIGTVTSPSISTYIRSQNNYALNLGVDTTNYLSISNTGNSFFNGNIILTTGANRYVRIGSSTAYYYDLQTTGDDFQIIEAGTTPRLTIKYPNGNVLIGTTTDAGFKLDVNGTGRFSGTGYSVFQGSAHLQTPSVIGLSVGYNRSGANGETTLVWGAPASGYNFEIASVLSGTITPRLTITSGGNVGIGITAPATKFHVNSGGTGSNSFSAFFTDNSANQNGLAISHFNNNSRIYATYNGTGSDQNLSFWTTLSNGTQFERLTILASGNVGIGTTTPNSRLHVAGDFRTVLTSGVGGDTLIAAINGVSNGYIINIDTSNNITHTWNTGTNTPSLRITPSGNVLIGTTTDSGAKFRVFGTSVSANIYSDNNTYCLGLGYQGTLHGYLGGISSALYAFSINGGQVFLNSSSVWAAVSDVKRKRNFEDYNLGLDSILGLKPKLYNMDFQKDGDQKQVGLVAQEVKDFIPLAYEENDKFIGLNYNAIIVTMVKAIQEQQSIINDLKEKIK